MLRTALLEGRWTPWVALVALLAVIAALTSIWRAPAHSRRAKIVWTAIVIVLPLVGPLAWFVMAK